MTKNGDFWTFFDQKRQKVSGLVWEGESKRCKKVWEIILGSKSVGESGKKVAIASPGWPKSGNFFAVFGPPFGHLGGCGVRKVGIENLVGKHTCVLKNMSPATWEGFF